MKVIIDNNSYEANEGETILEVCRRENIPVPTLCYHNAFKGQGACRFCMVEVREPGAVKSKLVASCTYPVKDNLEVISSSEKINRVRKTLVMLLYNRAPNSEYIRKLKDEYKVSPLPASGPGSERCIMCRLCIQACQTMGSNAIAAMFRGTDKEIGTPYNEASEDCIGCKACAEICPTSAIEVQENGSTRTIWNKTFTLVTCERCGEKFATIEQLEYVASKTGDTNAQRLCDNCRVKVLAEKMASFN